MCVKDRDAIVQAAVPAQEDPFNQRDSHLNREEKENILLSFYLGIRTLNALPRGLKI